jgi:hypothetical protein
MVTGMDDDVAIFIDGHAVDGYDRISDANGAGRN